MKKYILLALIALNSTVLVYSQNEIYRSWDKLLNMPGMTEYFSGIFNSLGIIVIETGEQFTVLNKSDHFEIVKGIDSGKVDYNVQLSLYNISTMEENGKDGIIDSIESFNIMSVLFTPLTQSAMANAQFSNAAKQKLAGIENHIHVYLNSPDKTNFTAHTLFFINGNWIVVPGLYGNAKRTFNLTPAQAIEYQRQVFAAQQINTKSEWKSFGKWYMKWRDGVSVKNK
ncbi:MAG: hypothetical protein IPG60_14375 [Bacteroidetes bacterium]|nr:hypothetical protein [Bacteroidota bacterium]MBP8753953.1 hypothetical protein [Chitinophagales bacterium]MBP9189914.1 hypothetical protein [Chitinophagales bacterium]MBP9548474.1 hypothetical protein [Chitinophagales bacterium]MBP9705195.1 hypothetical protein [Chitinophagales bacterium]